VRAQGSLSWPSREGSIGFDVADFSVAGLGTESLQHGAFTVRCINADGISQPMQSGEGAANWLPADRMGPYLAAAVIAAEDQRFAVHPGYDKTEIELTLAAFAKPPARGASTITQQLARTLYTGGDRTVARKLRELLYAVEMERTLGKARILDLYLNTVDWGPGLCGAKSAARTYFNRSPSNLTPLQAAWLAGILRNPAVAHASQFTARKPDTERARAVLMQMRSLPRTERLRWARSELNFASPRNAAPARTAGS
jgi:membrane peptidoglycan carboxypeptidase